MGNSDATRDTVKMRYKIWLFPF